MLGLDPYWTSVLTLAGIYAIAGIGLQLALSSGQFSVMHAALLGSGAYAAGAADSLLGLSFGITLLIAAAVAGVIGLVTAILLLPLDGLFFGIATLAVGQALSYAVQVIPNLGGPGGLAGVGLDTTPIYIPVVLIVLLAIYLWSRRQPWYLGLLAAGQDPSAAAAIGISPSRTRIAAFTTSSVIAGLAGGFYVHYVGLVQPTDLNFAAESQLLVFVVLGGVGTPFGAVVGALGVSSLLEILRVSSEDRYWMLGVALVLIMLLRPSGLLRRRAVSAAPGKWPRLVTPGPGRLSFRSGWAAALRRGRGWDTDAVDVDEPTTTSSSSSERDSTRSGPSPKG